MNTRIAVGVAAVIVAIGGVVLASYFGRQNGSGGEEEYGSGTYLRVEVTGTAAAYVDESAMDGSAVVCTAYGGYDMTLWFPTAAGKLNADGVFEAVKTRAVLHVNGYDCAGYNGAADQCTESLADGPADIPFDLASSGERVFFTPNGNDLSSGRVTIRAASPKTFPSVNVHMLCPRSESDTSDYGTSFSQLVMPLVSTPIVLDVPDRNDVQLDVLPALGNVRTDMELSVRGVFTTELDD